MLHIILHALQDLSPRMGETILKLMEMILQYNKCQSSDIRVILVNIVYGFIFMNSYYC